MAPNTGKIVVRCPVCSSFFKVSSLLSGKQVTCAKCRRPFIARETHGRKKTSPEDDFFLCKIALNYGIIDEPRLETVLKAYSLKNQGKENPGLDRILVTQGGISEDQLLLLKGIRENWDLRQAEKQYAAFAVEKRLIDETQARKALAEQARLYGKNRTVRLVCDILIENGALTREQCLSLLESQGLNRPLPVSRPQAKEPARTMERPTPQPLARQDDPGAVKAAPFPPPEASNPARGQAPVPENRPSPMPPRKGPVPETPVKKGPIPEEKPSVPREPEPVVGPDRRTSFHPEPESEETAPALSVAMTPEPESHEEEPAVSESDIAETLELLGPQEETPSEDAYGEDLSLGARTQTLTINGLTLLIAEDGLSATLRIPPDMDTSHITVDDIKTSLRELDIVFGIVDDALIRGFLNSKIFREKPFKIAEGKPAVPGKDGTVTFFFDTDYLKIGEVSESGAIDFKNRGEIPFVNEGTILAEIAPAVPGRNGKDIFGRDLLVREVKNVFLKCEHGASLSDDGRKAVATVSGQPKLSFGNRLHVLTEIVIPGDVGFETGHVDFDGNVTIRGSVHNDFHVKGANISAEEVLAAHIVAKGDLVVKTGISGAILDVEGDIRAKFINKSTIRAYGSIFTDREIIDCDIQTSGACVCRGKIVSSTISARQGLEAMDIGTEISKPCHLRIGVDDHIAHEVSLIDEEIEVQQNILENLENRMKELTDQGREIQKTIAGLAHIQDRSQVEQRELEKNLEQIKASGNTESLRELELKIEALTRKARDADNDINMNFDRQDALDAMVKQVREQIWNTKEQIMVLKKQKQDKLDWAEKIGTKAYIKTKGPVYSGTMITGKFSSRTLRETMRAVRIHEAVAPDTPEGWEIRLS